MILFDVLSDVLFTKKGDQFQTVDSETEVNPYMLNRWISMHSPQSAKIVNVTNNVLWSILQNKRDWYRFTFNMLPRNRFTKIEYLKKEKKEKKEKDDNAKIYETLARNLELSIREVKSYIEENNIDISSLQKIFKNEKRSV